MVNRRTSIDVLMRVTPPIDSGPLLISCVSRPLSRNRLAPQKHLGVFPSQSAARRSTNQVGTSYKNSDDSRPPLLQDAFRTCTKAKEIATCRTSSGLVRTVFFRARSLLLSGNWTYNSCVKSGAPLRNGLLQAQYPQALLLECNSRNSAIS